MYRSKWNDILYEQSKLLKTVQNKAESGHATVGLTFENMGELG